MHGYACEVGRDPARLPLEGRVRLAGQDVGQWMEQARRWQALGATHLVAEARNGGLGFPVQHLEALRRFRAAAAEL